MPFDSLTQVIRQFEQQPRWRTRGQFRLVQTNWSQIVGPAVACHARPVRLERQILYVAVTNPMWGQTPHPGTHQPAGQIAAAIPDGT